MDERPAQKTWSLEWPYAFGGAPIRANFRSCVEDFQVVELASPEAVDKGEHVYLHIQKRAANTAWVAQQLAQLAGVRVHDVGFYGLKDRHAVTTQWFSVWLGKKTEPRWQAINSDTVTLLNHFRGQRKLRRGEHDGNRFSLRLRKVHGDRSAAERVLTQIKTGVPNYFGEQRFGYDGGNLDMAHRLVMATDRRRIARSQRAFAVSAARSWLFNQVLAERVHRKNWRQLLNGDPQPYPTGPMWGRGRNLASLDQLELEQRSLTSWRRWCEWLEHCGLNQERRALEIKPTAFSYAWQESDLLLQFVLPPGSFATALLREVTKLSNLARVAAY